MGGLTLCSSYAPFALTIKRIWCQKYSLVFHGPCETNWSFKRKLNTAENKTIKLSEKLCDKKKQVQTLVKSSTPMQLLLKNHEQRKQKLSCNAKFHCARDSIIQRQKEKIKQLGQKLKWADKSLAQIKWDKTKLKLSNEQLEKELCNRIC